MHPGGNSRTLFVAGQCPVVLASAVNPACTSNRVANPAEAVPDKILEIMNVDGLTRDQVKSHLQGYRFSLKQVPGAQPAVPRQEPPTGL